MVPTAICDRLFAVVPHNRLENLVLCLVFGKIPNESIPIFRTAHQQVTHVRCPANAVDRSRVALQCQELGSVAKVHDVNVGRFMLDEGYSIAINPVDLAAQQRLLRLVQLIGVLHVAAVEKSEAAIGAAGDENVLVKRRERNVVHGALVPRELEHELLAHDVPDANDGVVARAGHDVQGGGAPVEGQHGARPALLAPHQPLRLDPVLPLLVLRDFEDSQAVRGGDERVVLLRLRTRQKLDLRHRKLSCRLVDCGDSALELHHLDEVFVFVVAGAERQPVFLILALRPPHGVERRTARVLVNSLRH